MFQSCLICTDFTDSLDRLVHFVPELAKSGLKKIVFFHSVSIWNQERFTVDEQEVLAAKKHLSPALENIPTGVEVKIEVHYGSPVDQIIEVIAHDQIEVIITATSIRTALEKRIFGGTSRELAQQTSTPLMIFRPPLIATYTQEELALRCQHLWRYVLIPYDDSERARYLLTQIKNYAQKRPSNSLQKCMLVWIVEGTGRDALLKTHRVQEAQEKLKALKAELEQLGLEVNFQVRQGNPVVEIAEAAKDFDISTIAICPESHHNPLEWAVPSLVDEVLQRIWFPLLFFPFKK